MLYKETAPATRLAANMNDKTKHEIFLDQAAEISDIGHWVYDEINQRYTYVSQSYADIMRTTHTGSSLDEWNEGDDLADVHPDDREVLAAAYEKCKTDGRRYSIKYRVITTAGETRWLNEIGAGLEQENGLWVKTIGTVKDITDSIHHDQALIESEKRFRSLNDSSPQGILVHRNFHPLYANQALADIFGYASPDELMSLPTTEALWPVNEHERIRKHHKDRLAGNPAPTDYEFDGIRRDGSIITLNNRSFLLEWKDGPAICSILFDVSKRKKTEESLRASEASLAHSQRMAQLGNWRRNLSTDSLISCSEEYARIHGVGMDEIHDLVNQNWNRLIHPDDRERINKAHDSLRLEGRDYALEYRIIRSDGQIRHILETGEAVADRKGHSLEQTGTIQDITSLRQAEELKATIVESALHAIITIDWQGKVVEFNPAAERMFDFTFEEVEGKDISDFIIPEKDREFHHKGMARFRKSGESSFIGTHAELTALRANGEEFPIEISVNHIANHNLFTAFIHDLTDQKRTEEALRRSQKMDAVGQLTGGIAHDFNNLLGVILGNLEILRDEIGENSPSMKWIDSALMNTRRGADLTRSLLKFSRKEPKEKKAVSANILIIEMGSMLWKPLNKAIDFRLDLEDDLWLTDIDPGDLKDALLNLTINAQDAMPQGGVLLLKTANCTLGDDHIFTSPDARPGNFVQISISDTGCGMTQEVIERAFEPFFTTKEIGKGTGLGLSMIFGFVNRSAGDISISSEPGIGTTFSLYLPQSLNRPSQARPSAPMNIDPLGGQECVLLVDDNEPLLKIAIKRLKGLGYSTLSAKDGASALDVLAGGEKIDLIFSDVVMHGDMNGFELAQHAIANNPQVKILLTSGMSTPDALAKAGVLIEDDFEQACFSNLLAKPYSRNELAAAVRGVLDQDD